MDPTYPEDGEADIAAQMGFTSFGVQPTAKKRKYNPATDAVTAVSATLPHKSPSPVDMRTSNRGGGRRGGDGRSLASSGARDRDRSGRGQGSGTNNTPLGDGRTREGSGSRGGEDGERGSTTAAPTTDADYHYPGHTDDISPASPAAMGDPDATPGQAEDRKEESARSNARSTAGVVKVGAEAKGHGEGPAVKSSEAGAGEQRNNQAALRRGVRNERGDVAYYDESFVEDPWKELEEKRGKGKSG